MKRYLFALLLLLTPMARAQEIERLRVGEFASNELAPWSGTFDERLRAQIVDVDDAPNGADFKRALRLTINPKAGEVPWALRVERNIEKSLAVGAPVTLRAWMRSPEKLSAGAFLNDRDNTDNKFVTAFPKLEPTWQRVEASGAVTKNFLADKAFLEFHVGYGAGTIDIADVEIALGKAPPPPPARDYDKLVFPTRLVSKASRSTLVDTTRITGAQLNERAITTTLRATPATLRAVLTRASELVRAGTPTRVRFAPGVYRDDLTSLKWSDGKGARTALVLEAESSGVLWTGAHVWPIETWKSEGDGLYSRAWNFEFGLLADPWGPPKTIGHRSEMAFADGVALRQVALERYRDSTGWLWGEAFGGKAPKHEFVGETEPQTLRHGEFGVFERQGSRKRIYVRLRQTPKNVEVSVRRGALDLGEKSNVVVRGVAFEKFSNNVRSNGPLSFMQGAKNARIERCRFAWNNMQGLQFGGEGWTIRDCVFSFNGASGLASGRSRNVVLSGNTTNFNNWRVYAGGERGWAFGGVKMHETRGLLVRNHQSIGNLTVGFWCDIHCHDVYFEGGQFGANATNLMWELSQGPYHGRKMLVFDPSGDQTSVKLWNNARTRIETSVFWKAASKRVDSPGALLDWLGQDRADEHAAMEPITYEGYELRDNVFAAEQGSARAFHLFDARSPFLPNFVPWYFKGRGNVYSAPGTLPIVWQDDNRARRQTAFPEWFVSPRVRETDAQFFDPQLRDPKNGDFRFAPSSPLYARRADYPQFVMSAGLRGQLAWFRAWTSAN